MKTYKTILGIKVMNQNILKYIYFLFGILLVSCDSYSTKIYSVDVTCDEDADMWFDIFYLSVSTSTDVYRVRVVADGYAFSLEEDTPGLWYGGVYGDDINTSCDDFITFEVTASGNSQDVSYFSYWGRIMSQFKHIHLKEDGVAYKNDIAGSLNYQ